MSSRRSPRSGDRHRFWHHEQENGREGPGARGHAGGCRAQNFDNLDVTFNEWKSLKSPGACSHGYSTTQSVFETDDEVAGVVDDFLAALSLGGDKKSARLERLVGRRLYQSEAKCRQFQHTAMQCMSAAEDLKEIIKEKEHELHSETLRADAAEHRCGQLEDALKDRHAGGPTQFMSSPLQHAHPAQGHLCAARGWPGSPAPSTAPHTPHVPSTIPYDPAPQHSFAAEASPHQDPSTRALMSENAQLKDEKNLLCIQLAEARSRAAAASRAACAREASPVPAETHASSLAHELEVTRRQLAEARCELELRRGSGGCGGAELTVSTPPPMRHGLQWSPSTTAHSQESQRLVTSDHAVLTEQLALAKKQAADADGRAEAATSDLARLRKALLDAELEMQTLTQRLGEHDRERTAAVEVADTASAKVQSAQARQADLESTMDELEKRLASERSKADTLDLEVHDKTLKLNKALASVAAAEEEAAVERAALRSKAAALQDALEAVAAERKQREALQRRHDEASSQLSEVQAMKRALQEECEELSKELRRVNADAAERAGCLEAELADLRRSSAAETSAMRTRHAEELRAVREGTLRERDTEVERARRDAAERVRRAEEDRDTAITRTAAAAAEEIQSVKARLEGKVAEAEAQRDSAEADRETRAARSHEDSLSAMAGLQASYNDSLARLRAAQEAETAALRSQISAAEESNRKACAEASYAQSQLSGLQAALLKKELVVKEAQDATAEQANQLSLQSAAAARLEEELVSLRADADAQREAGRRKAGEADERLEESVARLRDAEESVAARVRELTAVRDEMAVLQEEKSMLQRQVATMQVETTGLTGQCEALTAELEAIQGDMRTASGMLEAAQAQIAELEARTATAEQDSDAATAAKEEALMMLEATRKALAKAQTAAKSDITAAAGTLAGEQQRRLAAEAGAAEAREQARAASAALAAEQGSRNSQLERFQERVEAAEAQLSTARAEIKDKAQESQRRCESLEARLSEARAEAATATSERGQTAEALALAQSRLADAESRVTAAQDAAAAAEKRTARLREATAATDIKLRSAASENSELHRRIARIEQRASEAAAEAEVAIGGLQRRVQHLTHDLEAARSAQRGAEADAVEARRAAASAAAATAEAGVTMKRQLGAKSRQVENMAEKLLLQKKVLEGDCDTQVSLLRGALDERDRSLKRLRADLDAAESAREAADTRCRAADAAAVEATAAADSAAARASSLHAAVEELQAVLARRADDGHRLHALLADAAAAQEVISALEAELGDARAAAARRAGDASVPGPDDGVVHGMQLAGADEPGAASSDVSRGGCLESALGAEVEELRAENERLRGLLRDRGADLVSMRGEAAALQAALNEASAAALAEAVPATGLDGSPRTPLRVRLRDAERDRLHLQEQLAARERLLADMQGSAVASTATTVSLARPSAGATFGSSRADGLSVPRAPGSGDSARGSLGLGEAGGSPWTLSCASGASPAPGRTAALAALSSSPTLRHAFAAHQNLSGSPLHHSLQGGRARSAADPTAPAPPTLRPSPPVPLPDMMRLSPHPPPGSPPQHAQQPQHTRGAPQPSPQRRDGRGGSACATPDRPAPGTIAEQQEGLLMSADKQLRRLRMLKQTDAGWASGAATPVGNNRGGTAVQASLSGDGSRNASSSSDEDELLWQRAQRQHQEERSPHRR